MEKILELNEREEFGIFLVRQKNVNFKILLLLQSVNTFCIFDVV